MSAEPYRLLHRHSEKGYTEVPFQALPSEPEAVPLAIQRGLTRDAHQRRLAPIEVDEKIVRARMKSEGDWHRRRKWAKLLSQIQRRLIVGRDDL